MQEVAKFSNILIEYLEWHFADEVKLILGAWKNFLLFNLEFFSVLLLLRTLFSPWHRLHYSYGKGVDLRRYAEVFSFNLVSRVMGAMIRMALIVIGLLAEIFIFFIGLFVFLIWLLLPVLLLAGFGFGLKIFFHLFS